LSEDEVSQLLRKKEEQERRDEESQNEVTWYHEGSESMRRARFQIAEQSLRTAKKRIESQKIKNQLPDIEKSSKMQESYRYVRGFTNYCSEVGDTRPLSFCRFSPNSEMIVVASWSGVCKLWSVPDCKLLKTLNGHDCNCSSAVFHPQATLTQSTKSVNLASSSFDGRVNLWSLESDTPIANLKGHSPYRVSKVEFYPTGQYLAACCHDNSWRLWDLEATEEILHQEGHSKPVMDISFQCDGSICVTGGQDSYGRVWDLRTGRCIMFMEGHLKSILSVDFHPNGYQLATASEDNSVKIWDLRQSKCIYTIPAHQNLISKVKFQNTNGYYLLTCSYDYSLKLWSHPTWAPIKELKGHEQKVMGCDISPDNKWIVSCSYDKTFKLWSHEKV
jgi:U4/U6 small nuclear ribonucleoprotein PRP4